MTGCCARHGQEELFGERSARRDAERYRRRGADRMARSLARRASARGLDGTTVLEIGGGVGPVLLELLRRGAERGEIVELVPAYEPFARELAEEQGVGDRVAFRTADLAATPEEGAPADLVVLNKVVCCTPDGVELAGVAAALARRTLVVSHPRDAWWARAAIGVLNAGLRLMRRRFRVFVHPSRELDGAIEAHGFALASTANGPIFRIASFERG